MRSPPGDANATGWRIRSESPRVTVLTRRRLVSGAGLLWLPVLVAAIAILGAALDPPVAVPCGPTLFILVMLWPLPVERIRISEKRVAWKDRLLGHRFRTPLHRARVVVRTVGNERAIVLTDGGTEQLVALGPAEDVEALVEELHAALARAAG
jgi:hypothetical protein